MPETAESHSHTLTTNRNCTIELTNVTTNYCLARPRVYMESGFVFNPPQPTVRTGKTEVCSFVKDDHTASGAVGVLTYQLFDMRSRQGTEMMAIMFSVPFDYNFYKNWMAIGAYESSVDTDEKLYKEMYNSKDQTNFVRQEANGCGVLFRAREVDLRACMSNEGKAIIKMELYDRMG
ncbi:cytolysin RTX-A-like [Stegastes partitus]|uniref:Cytolysin RTX-A-like n=1 Tax=Stegastes partitus TaxID=144197 RepID=A0A3B4ZZY0_9TELE|nr:PREDICTED: cytolysin RTX-A-like [Stegastes partitus]